MLALERLRLRSFPNSTQGQFEYPVKPESPGVLLDTLVTSLNPVSSWGQSFVGLALVA